MMGILLTSSGQLLVCTDICRSLFKAIVSQVVISLILDVLDALVRDQILIFTLLQLRGGMGPVRRFHLLS